MEKTKTNRYKLIFVAAFVFFNILNSYLMTTDMVFQDISPYPRTFFMLINSFFGDFGFIMLFLGLAVLIFKRDYHRGKFIMHVSIILSIIFIALSIYIGYYKTFFSFYNLETFKTPAANESFLFLLRALPDLFIRAKFLFLLSPLVIILLFILIFRRNRKNPDFYQSSIVSGLNRIYIGILMFLIGILMMGNSLSAYFVDIDETWYEDNATSIYGVQSAGLFNYYLYDAYSYFFADEIYPEEKRTEIYENLKNKYTYPEQVSIIDGNVYGNSQYRGLFAGKNLLMIQMESVNNFVIGLTIEIDGQQVEVTPNLNRLLINSVYFDNFYHGVGIGNTSDTEFTSLTGFYPIGHNLTVNRYNNVQYQTLPNLFKDKGYFTFSSHANIGAFYGRAKNHPDLYGFDIHYSAENLIVNSDNLLHTWLSDVDLLYQTVDLMRLHGKEKPVFAFPITISNHIPYNKPSESESGWFDQKQDLFPDGFKLINSIANNQYIGYLEHVSYTDFAIGEMIKYLEETGLADDTVIMLYGDHGCGIEIFDIFCENPEIFENPVNVNITETDDKIAKKFIERRFIQNIPFIIYDASHEIICEDGNLEAQTISKVRGTNCIARTVANLFNLEPEYYFGVDALSEAVTFAYNPRNHDILVDGMIVSGQSGDYYIYNEDYLDYYTEEKIEDIIYAFQDYKDFNDKVLKYRIFPPLD